MVKLLDYPFVDNPALNEQFSKFNYPLRDFQKHTIEGIINNKNVLVIANTGNGKTVPCEFAFKHFIALGKKVIYTSPIKALSNQKFHDFSLLFPNCCGISTGDVTFKCEDAKIIIMTTEILRNMLLQNIDTNCNDTKCNDTKCNDTKCNDTNCNDTKCNDNNNNLSTNNCNDDNSLKNSFNNNSNNNNLSTNNCDDNNLLENICNNNNNLSTNNSNDDNDNNSNILIKVDNKKSSQMFDLSEIACIIFDEAHYINDTERGKIWEESIIHAPPTAQLLLLSATLKSPENFAKWIEIVQPNREVVIPMTLGRIVPLIHYCYYVVPPSLIKNIKDKELQQNIEKINNTLLVIKNSDDKPFIVENYNKIKLIKNCDFTHTPTNNNNSNSNSNNKTSTSSFKNVFSSNNSTLISTHFVLNSMSKFIKDNNMLPAICFVYSRKNIESWVKTIEINLFEDDSKIQYTIKEECKQILMKFPNYKEYLALPEFEIITNLLQKGISYHHAGLLSVFREMIEILFDRGYIKLLFATETFSIGLNLKIKTVIFSGLEKPIGRFSKRLLLPHEYTQGGGRAGRQGYDKVGNIIHLNNLFNLPTQNDYDFILNGGSQVITSKFKVTYNLVLNAISKSSDFKYCYDIIGKSMINIENINQTQYLEKQLDVLKQNLKSVKNIQRNISNNKLNNQEFEENMERLISLKKQYDSATFNKRKKIMKDLDEFKQIFSEQDIENFNKQKNLTNDIHALTTQISEINNYLIRNTDYVKNILVNNEFASIKNVESVRKVKFADNENDKIVKNDDIILKELLTLTLKGNIALNLFSVHPLAFTELLITTNYFESLNEKELVGLFSCFADVQCSEDDEIVLEHLVDDGKHDNLINTIDKLGILYFKYNDLETLSNINTGSHENIQLNLVNISMEWADAKDENDCKYIIQKLNSISLGDFIKAMNKVNNISLELTQIVGKFDSGKIEFLKKMSLISDMVLKFIVTNQSLYL